MLQNIVNMKGKLRKTLLANIKEKTNCCINSRKNANDLIEIVSILQDDDDVAVLAGVRSVHKIFAHYIEVGEMFMETSVAHEAASKEEKYKLWLRERYKHVVDDLIDLLQHTNSSIQELSLSTLMKFVSKEGKYPLKKVSGDHTYFPVVLYQRILSVLLSDEENFQTLLVRFQEYLEFDDVRFFTLKVILNMCQEQSKQEMTELLLGNIFCLLENTSIPTVSEDDSLSNFMSKLPEPGHKIYSLKEHKKLFTSAWVSFLRFKITTGLYRRVLVILHDKVMPYMTSPLVLSDFLTESYNVGGAISLLALNGLFVLVHKYNLNYPDFYSKLYALFEPSIFHAKYRSRFFHLCDLFLSSTHLPAYLVAAFAKRLAQICLTAPPSGLLIAVPFIYNLIKRHPSCKQLIDRPDAPSGSEDPYDPTEPDPVKCGALESSLWELKTLQHHFHPDVVKVAQKMDHALPDHETELSELLDLNDNDLFERECSKKVKSAAVTFEPPKGLFGLREDRLQLCWTL